MKYFVPFVAIATLLAACSKKSESTRCYQCMLEIHSVSGSLSQMPSTLCDQTDAQIKEYIKANTRKEYKIESRNGGKTWDTTITKQYIMTCN